MSTTPRSSSSPQWPWSVYSSRQRSEMRMRSSPRLERSSPSATCTIPSGSEAPDPVGSLREGTPKRTTAPMPSDERRLASATREATECCTTPGIEAIGTGTSIDSRTKRGAIRSSTPSDDSATSRRMTGSRRSRRNLRAGKLMAEITAAPRAGPFPAPRSRVLRRDPRRCAPAPQPRPRGRPPPQCAP